MVKGSRVIGYVRVSTSEQADSRGGLDAQREAVERECQHRGWQLVEIVEDAGYSGRNTKRPGLVRVLAMLKAGDVEGLVVAKLDRLSRSVVDFGGLLEASRDERWFLTALDFGLDTSTANGKLTANILMSVAEWERDVIGERTRDALAAKRAQGVRLGRPSAVPATVARRIRRARQRGDSLRTIADRLNADGVPTSQGGARWYASTISAVLGESKPR
ncbi:MAG TPA: recombinase family protein [Mycobacteriales bacterium]|nr:recombinase family protein [Mycobacteriales bacterium]